MTKIECEIDIKNESELLRIYENNLKHATSEAEKNKMNSHIECTKKEIESLEAQEKSL